MTLPATGKSVLFQGIQQSLQKKYDQQARIFLIQSDVVTLEIMQEFLKQNPGASHDAAFDFSRRSYRERYESKIKSVCLEAQSISVVGPRMRAKVDRDHLRQKSS